MSEEQLNDDLEARLASLQPRPSGLSRDRLLYLAGQTSVQRRLKMRKRLRVVGVGGALATAVALFLTSSLWLTQPAAAERAAQVLARGADAVPSPMTVHLVAKMRTPPDAEFDVIDADSALVPVEVWRQFGAAPKFRVEKSGYITVMDDTSVTSFRPPRHAWRNDRPAPGNMEHYPILLLQMAEVRGLLDRELRTALVRGWDLKLTHETAATGEKKLAVTVEAKSGWPENNYARNTFFGSSDMRRVYRFDAKTQRLEGLEAYLHRPGGDVLVLSVEQIDYGQPIDPARFVLTLPADVRLHDWRKEYKKPERLPDNEKYEKMTPKEAARAFFEACAKEDWDEVQKFEVSPLDESFKKRWGGLEIVHLGEPFKAKTYYGWYIPYEVKLKHGGIKKWNLAMRNDNAGNRYVEDGGM